MAPHPEELVVVIVNDGIAYDYYFADGHQTHIELTCDEAVVCKILSE